MSQVHKLKTRAHKEVKELFWTALVIMIIRTFLYQPFVIPSGSMIPELLVGDFLLVNKFVYGYGNETFPFRFKLMSDRWKHQNPKRGDIVVFNNYKDPELRDYVKRLIALPGEKVQVIDGVIHVNGKPFQLKRVEDYSYTERGRMLVVDQYVETNCDGHSYNILKRHSFGQGTGDNTKEYTVPEDHYFLMGNNRDNSIDSRWMEDVGFVHKEQLLGRADIIFFSSEAKWYEIHKWIFGMRPKRILKILN